MPRKRSDPVPVLRARLRAMFRQHDHRCTDCGIVFFCGGEFCTHEANGVCPACDRIRQLLADEIDEDAAACAAAMPDTP